MMPTDSNENINNAIDGSGDSCNIDKTKLIVNYIPQFTTEEDLMELFLQVGELESIRIMRNPRTGYSYGYGFVKYIKEYDAAKAIDTFNGLHFRNKNLKVSYSRPPGQATKDSNLYISNLPKDFSEDDLTDMFCKYGEIIQKNLLKDKITGLPRGVAFVRFAKGEEAQGAIAELDGKKLENCMFPLSVRVADDHTKQRAHMMEQQLQLCSRPGCMSRNTNHPVPPRGHMNQRNGGTNRYLGGGDTNYLNYLSEMFW